MSEPVPAVRANPMTTDAGGAQNQDTGIDHAFDIGVVLARAERSMVTNDGAGFDYARTAVNALRDRLRASAVIDAVADYSAAIPAPPPPTPPRQK